MMVLTKEKQSNYTIHPSNTDTYNIPTSFFPKKANFIIFFHKTQQYNILHTFIIYGSFYLFLYVCKKNNMDPNKGKKHLINLLSPEALKEKLDNEKFKRITVSFYRYVIIDNPIEFRDQLFKEWSNLNCLGRIYVAKEGINAQMNVPEHHWDNFIKQIQLHEYLKDIPLKMAIENGTSFLKLQIKIKDKIVADGLNDNTYDVTNVGKHLNAEEWNNEIDNGAIVVDMRNAYESEIGRFKNAILPKSDTFADELPEVLETLKGNENSKILLYCTGGVRCEKTSAFLKHHGFEDVNQLHGGIIDYRRQINEGNLDNKFEGKNFVFDNRLGERISDDIISKCHQCSKPCDNHINCANIRCNLLFIQCSDCAEKYANSCSDKCKEYVLASSDVKKQLDKIHQYKPIKRYNKNKQLC